jgi:hypothetical protein
MLELELGLASFTLKSGEPCPPIKRAFRFSRAMICQDRKAQRGVNRNPLAFPAPKNVHSCASRLWLVSGVLRPSRADREGLQRVELARSQRASEPRLRCRFAGRAAGVSIGRIVPVRRMAGNRRTRGVPTGSQSVSSEIYWDPVSLGRRAATTVKRRVSEDMSHPSVGSGGRRSISETHLDLTERGGEAE